MILAKADSQRIPHKNIRPFMGKAALLYSIEAAQEAGHHVVVSTDSGGIARLAEDAGAEAFKRSDASCKGPMVDALNEVLAVHKCDTVAMLYACAPLVTGDLVNEGVVLFEWTSYDVVTVVDSQKRPAGMYYITSPGFASQGTLAAPNTGYLTRDAVDIDTIEDWKRTEALWTN